jgi:pantoate--beta-alanine ligase
MKLIYNIYELGQYISLIKKDNKKTGFVPTMGALHKGHLALASKAVAENDVCICSIFVNPAQFDNAEDYAKYPRSLDSDIELFKQVKVDAVFIPSEQEMYTEKSTEKFDLGGLDLTMEGAYRPGHFNGVAVIVKKLFELVMPERAYFGEKDYQQLAIIRCLVKKQKIPVKIVACPIIREADGLAMSSRNQRLSAEERAAAPLIYETLKDARKKLKKLKVPEVKKWVTDKINSCKLLQLEYYEIVESESLRSAAVIKTNGQYQACIAVYAGKIRLIDNIKI